MKYRLQFSKGGWVKVGSVPGAAYEPSNASEAAEFDKTQADSYVAFLSQGYAKIAVVAVQTQTQQIPAVNPPGQKFKLSITSPGGPGTYWVKYDRRQWPSNGLGCVSEADASEFDAATAQAHEKTLQKYGWIVSAHPVSAPAQKFKLELHFRGQNPQWACRGSGAYGLGVTADQRRATEFDVVEAQVAEAHLNSMGWTVISHPVSAPAQNTDGWTTFTFKFGDGPAKAPGKTGHNCKRCNSRNDYAEANQGDGSYICWECR